MSLADHEDLELAESALSRLLALAGCREEEVHAAVAAARKDLPDIHTMSKENFAKYYKLIKQIEVEVMAEILEDHDTSLSVHEGAIFGKRLGGSCRNADEQKIITRGGEIFSAGILAAEVIEAKRVAAAWQAIAVP